MGTLPVGIPQVRGTEEPFPARVARAVGSRSAALDRVATRMWVLGRSQADVDAFFLEAVGSRVMARTGVSHLSRRLHDDVGAWQRRDLSPLKVVSRFLDAL
jgi:transposase-like protein